MKEFESVMDSFIAMRGVSKHYGATKALDDVDFTCAPGEIHAVLGENGAGKSTLMKLLSGVVQPTSGRIEIDGRATDLPSPAVAQALGIICIFQELSLSPDLSVAENILLGAPGVGAGFLRRSPLRRARALLDQIGGEGISLKGRVSNLSLGERQQVEIVKGLIRDPRLLILDEATSALTADVVSKVFDLIRDMRDQGVSVLFISHRFHEVEALADIVSVFRSGRHIETFPNNTRSYADIIGLMIGQRMDELFPPRPDTDPGDVVLEVDDLSVDREFDAVSMTTRHGEIVGIGGLDGQGQTKFLQAVFGCMKHVSGSVRINGRNVKIHSPRKAKTRSVGLALVPEDRKTEGLIPEMSIRENMELAAHGLHPMGLLSRDNGVAPDLYQTLIDELELTYGHIDDPVSSLSGGNQQKIALIKWLALSPDCILLIDPTRGIDVKTKAQIYRLLRRLAGDGMAVVLLSTDYDELVQLCDRVSIFYQGRICRELAKGDLTPENVISASLGVSGGADAA